MRVLILGAGGQVGRALHKAANCAHVTRLDRAACDLTDADAVAGAIREAQPEVVFNAAAYTAVDQAETEREAAFAANAQGAGVLAEAVRAAGARLIHVSTDYVFPGEAHAPYAPGDPTGPLNVYGASKLEGERLVLAAAPDALIVRTGWVYDAWGRNFLTTMLRLMREQEEVRVVCDQIGAPTSAAVLARGLWELAFAKASGVYHLTGAGVASWYDFAVAICEDAPPLGLTSRCRVLPILTSARPTPARRPAFSVLDCSTTWAALGGPPPHWRESLWKVLSEMAHG